MQSDLLLSDILYPQKRHEHPLHLTCIVNPLSQNAVQLLYS